MVTPKVQQSFNESAGVLEHTKHTRYVGNWLILFSGQKDDQAPGGGEA